MSDFTAHRDAIRAALRENGNEMARSDLVDAIKSRFDDLAGEPEPHADLKIGIAVDDMDSAIDADGDQIYDRHPSASLETTDSSGDPQ